MTDKKRCSVCEYIICECETDEDIALSMGHLPENHIIESKTKGEK